VSGADAVNATAASASRRPARKIPTPSPYIAGATCGPLPEKSSRVAAELSAAIRHGGRYAPRYRKRLAMKIGFIAFCLLTLAATLAARVSE
jgi:hypothetical protein